MPSSLTVAKVGGSLYDLPDLGDRLQQWLDVRSQADENVLLVPGGGATADLVRDLDRQHQLGEERSHWLALHALTLNAHFLASLLPGVRVITDLHDCSQVWESGEIPVLDAHAFARSDESRPGHLPHCWGVTSDSLAARVAHVVQAQQLVLLKSITIPTDLNWEEISRRGLVDEYFAEGVRQGDSDLQISAVNLRTWAK
jgi:aspartokinase-like uncharacterized kinase